MNGAADPFREQVGAYLLDALDELDRHRMGAHLDGCADCRREVDELAAMGELLGVLDEDDRRRLLAADDADRAGSTDLPTWLDVPADHPGWDGPTPRAPGDLVDRLLARAEGSSTTSADSSPAPTPPAVPTVAPATPPAVTLSAPTRRPPRWSRWAVPLTAAAAVTGGVVIAARSDEGTSRPEVAISALAPPAGSAAAARGQLQLTSTDHGSQVTMHVNGAVPGTRCVLFLLTGKGVQQRVAEWVVGDTGSADVRATTDLRPTDVPRALVETVDHQLLLAGTMTAS